MKIVGLPSASAIETNFPAITLKFPVTTFNFPVIIAQIITHGWILMQFVQRCSPMVIRKFALLFHYHSRTGRNPITIHTLLHGIPAFAGMTGCNSRLFYL